MKAQIKHLTDSDLQTAESTWKTFDNAFQRESAKFETKRNEKLICWHCGVRVPNQQMCAACGKPITSF